MAYNNLETYYRLTFALFHFQKWSPEFIENMMPFERDLYTTMLNQHLQEEEEKAKQKAK